MLFTADFHTRMMNARVQSAIGLVADVYAPAREYALEHSHLGNNGDAHFTVGYLRATIEGLLDALGYPEQGPNIDQRSWLPDPDDDLDDDDPDDEGRRDNQARMLWNKQHGYPEDGSYR